MSASGAAKVATALASVVFIAACTSPGGVETATPDGSEAAAAVDATISGPKDVEAPDVFQAIDKGLWDGRPSLGGIWVAHADVKDPERVMIRNEDNGKSVIGALFRREIENPGPRIQVSSDAAAALGMLAGSPATLNVVALKREEPKKPEPAPDTAVAGASGSDAGPSDAAAPGTPAGNAAAATAAAAAVGTEAATAEAPAKKRRFFWQKKPAEDAVEPATDAGATTPAAIETTVLPKSGTPAAKSASTAPVAASPAPVAAAPAPVVAAPADAAEPAPPPKKRGFFGFGRKAEPAGEPLSAIDPAGAAAAPVAAAPAKSATPKPRGNQFVEVGTFGDEAGARAATDKLAADGIIGTVHPSGAKWRVLVGPAASATDRDAVLKKAKALGFASAHTVAG